MLDSSTRITIAGAGSIGCHAGGCLALAGRRVALLARPRIADAVDAKGLAVSDLDGGERRVSVGSIPRLPIRCQPLPKPGSFW
jgi:2-dehydropantoate 2-reductase